VSVRREEILKDGDVRWFLAIRQVRELHRRLTIVVIAGLLVLGAGRLAWAGGVLRCTVAVADRGKHKVHITYQMWDVSDTVTLAYRGDGFDPDGDIAPIQNFRASMSGAPLSTVRKGTEYQVLLLAPATEERPLVISYDCVLHRMAPWCKPRGPYEAYLGPLFAIFRANYLLLQAEQEPALATLRFQLPASWQALTPWPVKDGAHVVWGAGEPNIDLGECVVGIGPFKVTQRQIGPTVVTVASVGDLNLLKSRPRPSQAHSGEALPRSQLAPLVFALFEYYLKIVGGCPIPRYAVFFHPLAEDGRCVIGSAWATGTAQSYLEQPELIAHEMFHWWNRVVPVGAGPWVSEGWTWHFAWEGIVNTGFSPRERWLRHLQGYYETYLAETVRPEMRAPATARDETLSPELLNSMIARREMLAYALDQELKAASNGAHRLGDAVSLLYRTFGPQPGQWRGREYKNQDVEEAVAAVGGARSLDFVRRHVFGTEVASVPALSTVWLKPSLLKEGVRTPVRLFIRPPQYLLRDRRRAALVLRITGNRFSRGQLGQMVSPSLRTDVALGAAELNKRGGTSGRIFDYDAEIVYTVQARKADGIWVADFRLLPVRGSKVFIWDSTYGDFSGTLHRIVSSLISGGATSP